MTGILPRAACTSAENAVDLASDDLAPLYAAARKHGLTIVCGIEERDDRFSRSTLYNTILIVGPDGSLLNRHRKLMPTNPERMVWGFGDASGLKVVQTRPGRIGTLLCWENYMPLARHAFNAQGMGSISHPPMTAATAGSAAYSTLLVKAAAGWWAVET